MDNARAVLDYWFGKLPLSPGELEVRMQDWFGESDPTTQSARDHDLATRFGALTRRAASGELASWDTSPRRRLALILLLDQFPRNIYRGTARAFLQDRAALALSLSGMQVGADGALDVVERMFFYMPLQHAESSEVQQESVRAFGRLLGDVPDELRAPFESALDSARRHRDIIAKFGRFPHRNAALGRFSTPEESEWLRAGGPRFGQ